MNPSRADWAKDSNCLTNPEPFSKNKPKREEYDPICSDCPVRLICRDHAVVNEERGIWGNTTEHERKLLRENKSLKWDHVPLEPIYQEQFERESGKDGPKLTAEEEIRLAEQDAKVQLEQLRARLALKPPAPVSGSLDSKALSARLSALRNRVRDISSRPIPVVEQLPGELAPSIILFHSC
jgi:Transcription factor WhiB